MNPLVRAMERGLHLADDVLAAGAALMLLATMGIVTADVFLRYFLNAPLSWSFDLISLFLMAGIFFFLLSDTFRAGGHIGVDIVQLRLSRRARHGCAALWCAIAAGVMIPMTWIGLQKAMAGYAKGEVLAGIVDWPVWIAYFLVPLGVGMLSLRLLLSTAGHLASCISDRDHVPLAGAGQHGGSAE